MALVKYIKDNIPETTIGFLTDDSSFRDYLINIVPVMFMFNNGFIKSVVEFKDGVILILYIFYRCYFLYFYESSYIVIYHLILL